MFKILISINTLLNDKYFITKIQLYAMYQKNTNFENKEYAKYGRQ